MNKPLFAKLEKNQEGPILIIDKKGLLGEKLIDFLKAESEKLQIVFVSQNELESSEKQTLVLTIPFKKRIPIIPDGEYTHILFIYNGEKETFPILKACVK